MLLIDFVDYSTHQQVLHQIRHHVFVEEQGIPAHLEMDSWDPQCLHVLAVHNQRPVGTGRLLPDGHIGRVAVCSTMRHRGVGTLIMHQLLHAAAAAGHSYVELSAQHHAIPFYQRLGFQIQGGMYREVGIDHVKMIKSLLPAAPLSPAALPASAKLLGPCRREADSAPRAAMLLSPHG